MHVERENASFATVPFLLMKMYRIAELENNLGISEKTLAEFIVELSKDKTSVKQFGQVRQLLGVLFSQTTIYAKSCICSSPNFSLVVL